MAGKPKNALPFNEQAVAKFAKTKSTKQLERPIAGVRGLSIVLKPLVRELKEGKEVERPGAATFLVRYQVGKGKKRQKRCQAIGRYEHGHEHGGLSLSDARTKAGEIMTAVAKGADPVAIEADRHSALTFRELFEQRSTKDAARAPRTMEDYKLALEVDVFDDLGDLPANEITPEQIAKVLERVELRSKHSAHKVRSAIGSTYRWGMKRRLVKFNPTAGLGFTHKSKPRNRVLTNEELARFWRTLNSAEFASTEPMKLILKLAVLSGQRNSEVCGAELSELEAMATATPRWRIPGERMKRKSREQIVPLSTQAAALFARAVELSKDKGGVYVFPGTTHGRREDREWRAEHIGQESVSRAAANAFALAGIEGATLHDLRKCVTTWLRENQIASPDVCDMILHHARGGVTASHYDFATLEGPVRKALAAWADHVEAVAAGQAEPRSNVVEFSRA